MVTYRVEAKQDQHTNGNELFEGMKENKNTKEQELVMYGAEEVVHNNEKLEEVLEEVL